MPNIDFQDIFIEKEKSDLIPEIHSLSKSELVDLLERQNRLIKSSALSHLKDKGEKVKILKKQIEEELERRNKAEDLCEGLTKLSIKEKQIEVIEWGEKQIRKVKNEPQNDILNEEKNPLALIATHSGTLQNKRVIKVEEPDEPLVTLADIEEAYALSLCNKIDKTEAKNKFLPHKTLKTNTGTSKPCKVRDLSAATPPAPVFGDVKLITLAESMKLQYEQTKHLKEVQLKHATERLKSSRFRIGETLPSSDHLSQYREHSPLHSEEETDEECNNGNE